MKKSNFVQKDSIRIIIYILGQHISCAKVLKLMLGSYDIQKAFLFLNSTLIFSLAFVACSDDKNGTSAPINDNPPLFFYNGHRNELFQQYHSKFLKRKQNKNRYTWHV